MELDVSNSAIVASKMEHSIPDHTLCPNSGCKRCYPDPFRLDIYTINGYVKSSYGLEVNE